MVEVIKVAQGCADVSEVGFNIAFLIEKDVNARLSSYLYNAIKGR